MCKAHRNVVLILRTMNLHLYQIYSHFSDGAVMLIKWLSFFLPPFFLGFWCNTSDAFRLVYVLPLYIYIYMHSWVKYRHCISVGKIIIWSPAEILSFLNYKEMMKWNENVANFYCSFNEVDKKKPNKNTFNFQCVF